MAALLVPLALAGGCSSAELAADLDNGDSGASEGTGPDDGTDESDATGGTGSGTDTGGDGDGDGDGTEPIGVEDPGLALAACAADSGSLLAYDLTAAQDELAPALVRESVLAGPGVVPAIPLLAQPFLNHFEFNYPAADGDSLDVVGELWKPPVVNADRVARYRLQYAVRAPALGPEQRPPVDLAIVVDLGPSMVGEPLSLAAEALAALDSALVVGDRVTLIAAGDQPKVLVEGLLVDQLGLGPLSGMLAGEGPAGSGSVGAALAQAYEILTPAWDGQGQARVLLVSNGHFQLDDATVELVADQAVSDRYLLTLGVGEPGMIAADALARLAAEGRGSLLYERDPEGVWADLQARFAEHLVAAATELEVSLELPPGLGVRDRDQLEPSGAEAKLGLLGVGDQLVFHHELEACAELDPTAVVRVTIEWNDPSSGEAQQVVWDQSVAELGFGSMDTRKGAAAVAYVRALRAYRDGDPSASYGAVLDAISQIAEALETQPEDPDLLEMSQVLGTLEG